MATKQLLKPGDLYTGPKSIDTIDGITAHYAETKNGPVRLINIDLAPDNPEDGRVEYRVAGPDDVFQEPTVYVDLLPDMIHGKASSEV
jgi:hypothetical protein